MMNKNNKGFSLVELIVVVLIIGIISGGATVAISVVYNANVEKAAKTICSMMNEARIQAIGQNSGSSEVSLNITQDTDGNCYAYISVGGAEEEHKKLANYKVDLFVGEKNSTDANRVHLIGSTETPSTGETNALKYTFSKSTGGISQAGASGEDWYDIVLKGSKEIKIIIVQATGRCYIVE